MNFLYRFFIFTLFFNVFSAYGQTGSLDSAIVNFERYARQNQNNSVLFVHFDRTEYSNFDKVYFTGYLIRSEVDLRRHTVLYVSLVKNRNNAVVYQDKFLIENGFSFGEFKILDSISSGNYRFVVNTDIKIKDRPEMEFVQPVVIKSLYIDPLVPSATLKTEYNEQTKEGEVLLKTMTNNLRFVADAEVEYTVNTSKTVIKKGKFKTNSIGEGVVNYPAGQTVPDSSYIDFKVSKRLGTKESSDLVSAEGLVIRYLKFFIPKVQQPSYQAGFYPEGGHLVNGLRSKIGLELKDREGNLIKGSIIILENNLPIDTVQTSSVGIGKFSLIPKVGNEYTAKLLNEKQPEQVFKLPKALDMGCVLNLSEAVVDSVLYIKVQTNKDQKLTFLIHNYKNIFALQTLKVQANNTLKIKLELKNVPTGLNTVTVLDSLSRPVAERMFFAGYNSIAPVKIDLDTSDFKLRSLVNAKLSIADNHKTLKNALVSIACVKSDKISTLYSQNITDYVYLDNNINGLAQHPMGYKIGDKDFLEDILLVKYWRKYKWPESIKTEVTVPGNYKFTGKIFKGTAPVKEAIELAVISGGSFKLLSTDNKGFFEFKNEDIFKSNDKKLILSLSKKNNSSYTFELKDPTDSIKYHIEHSIYKDPFYKMSILNETVQKQIISAGIKLKDVNITQNKEQVNDGYMIRNSCGDYVCKNNILNCLNHVGDFGNKIPVPGQRYNIVSSGGGFIKIVYMDCVGAEKPQNFQLIIGINLPKEFYVSDVNNKNEPINFQTIYWEYQKQIRAGQPTSLSFYTGDLTGKFKIIVQGITEQGLVYGEKEISVNK